MIVDRHLPAAKSLRSFEKTKSAIEPTSSLVT